MWYNVVKSGMIFDIFTPYNHESGMINLIGTYECKADAKGRVMLPSALKKQLASILAR